MSLFEEDPQKPPVQPEPVKVNPTPYKGQPVNSKINPVGTLLTAVAGSRWIVTWFSQVLGEDDEWTGFQRSRLAINQQYRKINELELKVTTPLPRNPSLQQEGQEFDVRGEANMYPGVIPNPGDMFTADTGDGRRGLYMVIPPVQTRSIYTQTTYTIEYVLVAYWNEDFARRFAKKTVQEYYFVRDFLDTGINPLITVEADGLYQKLLDIRDTLPRHYLGTFFDREYATLTLPGQDETIYDPFFAYFATALFASIAEGTVNGMNHIAVMDGARHGYRTFLNALMDQDISYMDNCETKIPIVDSASFLKEPYYGGIRYSGIPWVIYPVNREVYANIRYGLRWPDTMGLRGGERAESRFRLPLSYIFPNPTFGAMLTLTKPAQESRDIKPVTEDSYYIFTESFYARIEGELSLLENMVWQALESDTVDPKEVLRLLEESRTWPLLEQFYYQPILYALIPSAFRGLP
jgi:hypothetical protein